MIKNNESIDKYKIQVFDGKTWIDVTDRKVIIYGAGRGCLSMMDELLLPNVSLVVDGNKDLSGKGIVLLGKSFDIHAPSILNDLDYNKYYIVVSSDIYFESIRSDILEICGDKYLVCSWRKGIRFCYKSLYTMLLTDNDVHRKLFNSRMTRNTYEIISDFEWMKKQLKLEESVEYYIPAKEGGSKFSFIFGGDKELWIYHHFGYVNSSEKRILEREQDNVKKIRAEFVDKNKLDIPLTIWKSNQSFTQIYADNRLDYYDEQLRKKVIKKIRELNGFTPDNLPEFELLSVFFDDNIERIEKSTIKADKKYEIIKIAKSIEESSRDYIVNATKYSCVIHGDLICDNIVSYKNDLYFIDWEYISKGFPEIDICYFLFSVNYAEYNKQKIVYWDMCEKCYMDIYDSITEYYGNKIDVEKEKIAEATMDYCLLREALQTCLWNQDLGIEKLRIIYNLKNDKAIMQEEKDV